MNHAEPSAPTMSWWLKVLYAILAVAALAFAIMLVGDLIALVEGGSEHGAGDEGLHHLFIFDLAWPVFLVAGAVSLFAGVGAIIVWLVRRPPFLGRYATLTIGFIAVTLAVLLGSGQLEL